MKYVIDSSKEFEGFVITSMSDDKHSDYGRETLEELQARMKECKLKIIDDDELSKLYNDYIQRLNKTPFEEIDQDTYERSLDCLPPARMDHNFFFVGEPYYGKVYPICFCIGGLFFRGIRSINTPTEKLRTEIVEFAKTLKPKENDCKI